MASKYVEEYPIAPMEFEGEASTNFDQAWWNMPREIAGNTCEKCGHGCMMLSIYGNPPDNVQCCVEGCTCTTFVGTHDPRLCGC